MILYAYMHMSIVWSQDKVEESIEYMGGGRLTGMNSARQIEYLRMH